MKLNTLRTIIGYLRSLIEKKLGIDLKRNTLSGIYNYRRVSIGLNTSGQPTAKQFVAIKEAGIKVVLNLAPSSAENAIHGEQEIVEQLGMQYIHMPVDFKAPTDQDFANFVEILSRYDVSDIWVHCAANMRVSAFVYRYRVQELGQELEAALQDLSAIWEPFGVWKTFIKK